MPDYTGNRKAQAASNPLDKTAEVEREKIEPVVTGVVIVKKRGIGSKFKSVFLGGDMKNAARYVMAEVVLPSLRNLLADAGTKGIERVVFGESSVRPRRQSSFNYGSRIQYNNPIQRTDLRGARLPDQPPYGNRPVTQRDSDVVIVSSREEADMIVERLNDIVDQYQVASVADLNSLLSLPIAVIDNKWGWTNLNNTEVRQVREGYLIDLPRVEEI